MYISEQMANRIITLMMVFVVSFVGGVFGAISASHSIKASTDRYEIITYPPLVTDRSVLYEEQALDENFDILTPSGYTVEDLVAICDDPARQEMIPYIPAIVEAEKDYGVNAFYLTCKLGLESGWGKYESGTHNIAGWTTYSGRYKDFSSPEECIDTVAKSLSQDYAEAVGTRLEDVCARYCPDPNYTTVLLGIMQERSEVIAA